MLYCQSASKSSRSKDLCTAFCQHLKRLAIVAASACKEEQLSTLP